MTRFAGESVDISSYMPERNFTELGQIGQKSRGLLTQSALYNKANVAIGGLKGSAAALGGKLKASAIEEAGRAQARATQSAGMWDMIGSIGTGVIGGIKNGMGGGGFSYGNTPMGAGGGSVGGTGTLGPNYGFPSP